MNYVTYRAVFEVSTTPVTATAAVLEEIFVAEQQCISTLRLRPRSLYYGVKSPANPCTADEFYRHSLAVINTTGGPSQSDLTRRVFSFGCHFWRIALTRSPRREPTTT